MANKAAGYLECAGIGAALYAMDKACKKADIRLLGIDTINPKDVSHFIPLTVQVKFEGAVGDVQAAVEEAKRAADELSGEETALVSILEAPWDGTAKLNGISKIKLSNE